MKTKILAAAILATFAATANAVENQYIGAAVDVSNSGGSVRYGHFLPGFDNGKNMLTVEIEAKRAAVTHTSSSPASPAGNVVGDSVIFENRLSVAPTLHFGMTTLNTSDNLWIVGGIAKAGLQVGQGTSPALVTGVGVELMNPLDGYIIDARFDHAQGQQDALLIGFSKLF